MVEVRMVEEGSVKMEARGQKKSKLEKLKIESGRLKLEKEKELGCCGQFLL